MNRSHRSSLIVVLAATAAAGCAAGLGIGMWTLLQQAGAGTLVVRGVLVLLAVAMLAVIPALLLGRKHARSVRAIREGLQQMRQGNLRCDPRTQGPEELDRIGDGLRELGVSLEVRERDARQRNQKDARDLRKDALMRFGQGVAREVQKSLAGVLGYVGIAMRQPGVEGQLKNYLTLMEQEARAGREALERILRYVRDEPFPTEPVDVNALAVETSRTFLDALERDQIQVQMNLAKDLPRVPADASQIRYVLSALIENAREAVLPGGGSLEISTNRDQQGRVVMLVRDDGSGIPRDEQDRIFSPFHTTKGSQKGAGLSLAIAERIVDRHGGKLDFWSEMGKGTVFFITLPLAPSTAPGTGRNESPPENAKV